MLAQNHNKGILAKATLEPPQRELNRGKNVSTLFPSPLSLPLSSRDNVNINTVPKYTYTKNSCGKSEQNFYKCTAGINSVLKTIESIRNEIKARNIVAQKK